MLFPGVHLHGLIKNVQDLHTIVENYAKYQMLSRLDVTEYVNQLCNLVEENADGQLKVSSEEMPIQFRNADIEDIIADAISQVGPCQLDNLPEQPNLLLNEEQQNHVDELSSEQCSGIHIWSGVPGAGKTFCSKRIARNNLLAGRKVLLAATTGAAASQLSASVQGGQFIPLPTAVSQDSTCALCLKNTLYTTKSKQQMASSSTKCQC